MTVTSAQDPTKSDKAAVTIVKVIPIPTPIPIPGPTPVPPIVSASSHVQPGASNIPPVFPPVDVYGAYDYMVTAPFVFPFGLKITLAALSVGQAPVQAPVFLASAVSQVNAPLQRNQAAPAVVRITWQAADVPQGYGVLASRRAKPIASF